MSGVPSEPADDLDWALSSGQVSGINLAESLLSAYYIPVFRLELFLLQSPQAAGEATLKAFEAALGTPYHAAVSPRSWLLDLARKAGLRRAKKARAVSLTESQPADRLERAFWQAFDALSLDDRLVIFAHHVLGLTTDELSEFLHLRQEQAAQRLATAQAYLQESQQGTGLSWSATGAVLAHRWPAPRLEQ
ncbi:MAG TPA: hypothetical protein VF823_05480, partial [Anaerolineales bacterium]